MDLIVYDTATAQSWTNAHLEFIQIAISNQVLWRVENWLSKNIDYRSSVVLIIKTPQAIYLAHTGNGVINFSYR